MSKLIKRTTLTVNVLLIVGLALPVFAMIGMFLAVNFQLWGSIKVPDFLLSKMQRAELRDGIETGTDPADLKTLYVKLSGLSAHASDAVLAENLHIVFVEFDETVHIGGETGPNPSATKAIGVDVTNPGDAAMVMVANRPALLKISAGDRQPVARLAVEGRHPFDIQGAGHGLLAGFRIDAFGAYGSATPDDLQAGGKAGRKLCELIGRWRNFFDVSPGNITIWRVTNPETVRLTKRRIETPGNTTVDLWRGDLSCLNR